MPSTAASVTGVVADHSSSNCSRYVWHQKQGVADAAGPASVAETSQPHLVLLLAHNWLQVSYE